MARNDAGNAEQIAYWNGEAGLRWTRRQEMQDAVLAPISEALLQRAAVQPGERVVDVGCGCGATTVALAEQVGPAGRVVGIDISAPMLARARERTPAEAPVVYVEADATVHVFEPAAVDLVFSRFGVMFFAEPAVSFANIRKGLRPGGRLAFVCWREPRLNPWLLAPLQAAYQHVPKMPEVGPEEPGPFAFASEARVRGILEAAGFSDVGLEPVDFMIDLAVGRGLDAAVTTALEIGPASRALDGQPQALRDAASRSIRNMLGAHLKGETVSLPGAVWMVGAASP